MYFTGYTGYSVLDFYMNCDIKFFEPWSKFCLNIEFFAKSKLIKMN